MGEERTSPRQSSRFQSLQAEPVWSKLLLAFQVADLFHQLGWIYNALGKKAVRS